MSEQAMATVDRSTDEAAFRYRDARRDFWDSRANADPSRASRAYLDRLNELFAFTIAPGQRVLEIGCGQGDLLASLQPSYGVGIDLAPEMVAAAEQRHPALNFHLADAHEFHTDEHFDVIVLSDLINDLWDVALVSEVAETSQKWIAMEVDPDRAGAGCERAP